MKIKILFDQFAVDSHFSTGWGFSCLVDNKILFDTGEKFSFLLRNMDLMGVSPLDLKTVVISHDHWDHRGGLWGILKKNPKLKVYACPHFSKQFKDKVKSYGAGFIEANKFTKIEKGIYSTGEIEGRHAFKKIYEQAVAIETENGLVVLTGCAHPGIINVIENVKRNIPGSINLVLGGFHLKGKRGKTVERIADRLKQLGVKKVAPCHCSGKNASQLFRRIFKEDCLEVKVGQIIDVYG